MAAYAALLFYLSSLPQKTIQWVHLWDKFIHAGIYIGFSWVLLWALDPVRRQWTRLRMMTIATVGAILYGITDELHQYFVITRNSDWKDVIADMVGGAIGGFLYIVITRHASPKSSSNKVSANDSALEAH